MWKGAGPIHHPSGELEAQTTNVMDVAVNSPNSFSMVAIFLSMMRTMSFACDLAETEEEPGDSCDEDALEDSCAAIDPDAAIAAQDGPIDMDEAAMVGMEFEEEIPDEEEGLQLIG